MTKPQRKLLEKLFTVRVHGFSWLDLSMPECRLVTSLSNRFQWVEWVPATKNTGRMARITASGIAALNEAKGTNHENEL
jgi:hypothetical protein